MLKIENKSFKSLVFIFILINLSVFVWAGYDLYIISKDLDPVINSQKFKDTPIVSLQAANVLNNMSVEEKVENIDKTINLYTGLSQFSVDRNVVIFELLDAVKEYNFVVIALVLSNAILLVLGFRKLQSN